MATSTLFRTSINVNYDIGKREFFQNYLPTPSHAESIIGISKGFYDENASTSHIMIGPYGSGKSLLATVIASFVSKKVEKNIINSLIEKFYNVHQDVYVSLTELNQIKREYIPVVLNGSYQNFAKAILENIEKTLKDEGIKISLPTVRNKIISTLNNWRYNYPETYYKFNQFLSERNFDETDWKNEVLKGNEREIKWFKDIYPLLTSGAIFAIESNDDFVKNLEYILEILKKNNIGLFIIHDEFGRHLQNIDSERVYEEMQDLQDVAEFSNRSDQYIQLLYITHKGMSQYMLGFNENYQSEFQRIEKRYSTYFVESDTATFYRIVYKYLDGYEYNKLLTSKLIAENTNRLRMFNLFQNLNQHEIENLVIKGCYPIHPITLFLLPRISKVLGQNERTLFTYLESNHTYGFKNQIKDTNDSYVLADTLFHYFFTDEIFHEIQDENIKRIINTYQVIRSNLDARKRNAYRIIHLITMWELTNSNNIYKLDTDLIEYATQIQRGRLDKIIKELTTLKFIRYNRIQKKWELSEGSSTIIEELIQEKKFKLRINNFMRIQEISNLLKNRYYLARKYNDEKNITRFMKVKLTKAEDFLGKEISVKDFMEEKSDGTICYILFEDLKNRYVVEKTVKKLKHPQLIFGILNVETYKMYRIIDDIIVIRELLTKKSLLLDNKNLKEELNVLLKDLKYEVEEFLKNFTDFKQNVNWIYKGKDISLNNQLELENLISSIMYKIYRKTPIIMNDSINRFNVVGIQKRSLYEVVNRVLNNPYEKNIGIKGFGPDYLTYATVIKNQGICFQDLDCIDNDIYLSIRRKLLSHLSKENKGIVADLYKILHSSPYGIRPPLIPLLLLALLRDKWDQLMFYRNEVFVPALEGEKIYKMFEEPEKYQYVYHDFEEDVIKFMDNIERNVSKFISNNVLDETQIIRVSSGLLNWLRSLPRQVQITEKQDNKLIELKTIIRRSEINPIQSLEDLIQLFDGDFDNLKRSMIDLEKSYDSFKQKVMLDILSIFKKDSLKDIKDYILTLDQNIVTRNRLLTTLIKETNIEDIAVNYVGTELEQWSDINYELFIKQMQEDFRSINNNQNEINKNQIELFVDNSYKPIRKVNLSNRGKLIYTNVNRIIQNAGRSLSKEEIEFIIYKLLQEYVE